MSWWTSANCFWAVLHTLKKQEIHRNPHLKPTISKHTLKPHFFYCAQQTYSCGFATHRPERSETWFTWFPVSVVFYHWPPAKCPWDECTIAILVIHTGNQTGLLCEPPMKSWLMNIVDPNVCCHLRRNGLVLKRGSAWLSCRWEDSGYLLWPRRYLGPVWPSYAAIHPNPLRMFDVFFRKCRHRQHIEEWTPWFSKPRFTWTQPLKF